MVCVRRGEHRGASEFRTVSGWTKSACGKVNKLYDTRWKLDVSLWIYSGEGHVRGGMGVDVPNSNNNNNNNNNNRDMPAS